MNTALRDSYLAALAGSRPREAAALVDAALEDGVSAREMYLDVLQPALEEVGCRWERGEMSVAQEHLATAVTESILARIAPGLRSGAQRDLRIIVACTPGELHSVGARFVSDFLEGDGWDVLTLGASTPPDAVRDLAARERPAAVALSTTLPQNLRSAAEVFALVREMPDRPLLVAGGGAYRGSEERALRLGADVFIPDAESLRAQLAERFGTAA